jgi:hypothetical protein
VARHRRTVRAPVPARHWRSISAELAKCAAPCWAADPDAAVTDGRIETTLTGGTYVDGNLHPPWISQIFFVNGSSVERGLSASLK